MTQVASPCCQAQQIQLECQGNTVGNVDSSNVYNVDNKKIATILRLLHSQCQDIGRPAFQENNPRRAVAQVLSLPLSMSPGKLWVLISVVKISHVYVVQANTVSQGVPWFVKLSTFRPKILVFLVHLMCSGPYRDPWLEGRWGKPEGN